MLPPDAARLFTKPEPTGSKFCRKMIGIVCVSCMTAAVTGVEMTTITLGSNATSSLARAFIASTEPPAHRFSIRTLRPSVHPNPCSPWTSAALFRSPSESPATSDRNMATRGRRADALRAHGDVFAEQLAGPGGSVRPLGKVISQAQAPGVNGERRVHATRAGQYAAVGHVEVVHTVHLAPGIDHRGRRVSAGHHAAQSMGRPGEARVSGHAGQPSMQDATLERSDHGVMLVDRRL